MVNPTVTRPHPQDPPCVNDDVRWTITPQGRAALDAVTAPAVRPEVLHGLTPQEYRRAYLVGWNNHTGTCPWWGGAMEVAWEDGLLDREHGCLWGTPTLGYEGATR